MERSAYHLMHGHQAITMLFWQLLHTTLIRMVIWVFIILLFFVHTLYKANFVYVRRVIDRLL